MTPRAPVALVVAVAVSSVGLSFVQGCNGVSQFSNTYSGTIVAGGPDESSSFVRVGFVPNMALCLSLDASNLQGAAGTLSSNDGRFQDTPLRPIPQIWHDPLSTLTFGEGRLQNLVYIVTPVVDADALGDVTMVLSLMQTGTVEVRLFRGAPSLDSSGPGANNLFGVFTLSRIQGPCSF
jgi:hypothetical protein